MSVLGYLDPKEFKKIRVETSTSARQSKKMLFCPFGSLFGLWLWFSLLGGLALGG